MIKKITAISFILLANIVLLAHTVIPHHHHDAIVCVEQTHCQHHAQHHSDGLAEQEHQHDDDDNDSSCQVKESLMALFSHGRYCRCCDNDVAHHNHHHDFYLYETFACTSVQPISTVVPNYPLQASCVPSCVTSAVGLRAPPTV